VPQQRRRVERRAGTTDHIADNLLAIDRIGHADGGGFDHVGALHQAGVDFERRNLGAAADNQFLFAAREHQKAVAVEAADIASADAAAGVHADCAVFGEITERMIGPAADLDRADVAGGQAAPVAIDDGDVMIGECPPDGAEAALLAGNGGDPAGLAGAIALRDANAEFLLEPLPFVEQQRRRTRRDKTQFRQRIAFELDFAVEQNVQRGRIAGGDRHVMVAQMAEKPAGGELFGKHQCGAAIDRRERAEELR
jgi:hypothetical protein